jgi:cysteine desulfurase / selenocysteine lyase
MGSPFTPAEVDTLRAAEFAALADTTYLNAASVAPLPERARAAVDGFNRRRARVHELEDADFSGTLHRCRAAAARLIGADADEIALGGNTSYGLNLAALGLPLRPGSTIVTTDTEFPANVYPWMAQETRDIRFELVPADSRGLPDEERLLERLQRGDVSVFALSAVQFGSGYRADLARFGAACREAGIFFVVDAIQAVGCLPVDVRAMRIDVLATGGHKWLCGPFGTGFAYVRREIQDDLAPRVIGWSSMQSTRDFAQLTGYEMDFLEDARRYEVATLPFQELLGFAHSMELLLEREIERVEAHVLALLDPLVAWLQERAGVEIVSDLDAAHRSGILAFRTPAPAATFAALERAGVVCAYREGAVRIAPHLYNTQAEIERVVEVLSDQGWS